MRAPEVPRRWTAVVTVAGYGPMACSFSEHDEHDEQIMQAAHEAVRLMRRSGVNLGLIDLFEYTEEAGSQYVERRTVRFEQRGLVVSPNLLDKHA